MQASLTWLQQVVNLQIYRFLACNQGYINHFCIYMQTYFHLPKDIFLIISISGLDCYFRSQVK